MQKKEFEPTKEVKENAMKYFPDFFGADDSILTNKTLEQLRKVYLDYCEDYFTRNSPKDIANKTNIKKAYDYMESILENTEKNYQIKNEIVQNLLISYEALIFVIVGYRFKAKRKNSYGFHQTKTNKRILFEISLLKPMITMALENIDFYLKKINSVTEFSEFDHQLIATLEEARKQFDQILLQIISAKNNYQNMWNAVNRGSIYGSMIDCSYLDLGKAKLKWKQAKNNGCHAVLSFCNQLLEINMTLKENMVYSKEEIKHAYQGGIINITKGPNYYSYLSEEEKKEIAKQNVLRKQQKKLL